MESNIDIRAFWNITYGLYIVTSCYQGKFNGQISNALVQVTDQPPKLAVCINKQELTHDFIVNSGHFGVSVMEKEVPMKLIGLFGFKSGRDIDKLSQAQFKIGPDGCPLVIENTLALFETKVVQSLDVGSHTLFVGEVIYSELLKQGSPITYAYYHEVKKGKSPEFSPVSKEEPKTAKEIKVDTSEPSAERSNKMKKYVCNVCGYIYNPEEGDPDGGIEPGTAFEDIPEGWVCPICGVGKEEFSLA